MNDLILIFFGILLLAHIAAIIIFYFRKKAKAPEAPDIRHVDWVARKAFITHDGIEYIYDFRVTNNTVKINDYSVCSSVDGLSVYILFKNIEIHRRKNPHYG